MTKPMPDTPSAEREAPIFLTIGRGGDRVYCVGCKSWQPTEGYCEGDPDICPIGEEDQGRSPTLAEAQDAIDKLAAEMSALDDSAVQQLNERDATIADLRSRLSSAEAAGSEDTARIDAMEAAKQNIFAPDAVTPHWCVRGYLDRPTLRAAIDAARASRSPSLPEQPTPESSDGK